jgi:hypothetical protein
VRRHHGALSTRLPRWAPHPYSGDSGIIRSPGLHGLRGRKKRRGRRRLSAGSIVPRHRRVCLTPGAARGAIAAGSSSIGIGPRGRRFPPASAVFRAGGPLFHPRPDPRVPRDHATGWRERTGADASPTSRRAGWTGRAAKQSIGPERGNVESRYRPGDCPGRGAQVTSPLVDT